jgi:hypothetical protein
VLWDKGKEGVTVRGRKEGREVGREVDNILSSIKER